MKGGGGGDQTDHTPPPPSPGKTTLKKPSLIRVKESPDILIEINAIVNSYLKLRS